MTANDVKRSIFVTGAASGIGRATARLFAERGWFVGAADVSEAGLRDLRSGIGAEACLTWTFDVADRAAYAVAIEAFAQATGGRMDLLFNNAGVAASGAFDTMAWPTVQRLIGTNLLGAMTGIQLAMPLLKATPGSLCFSTASATAIFGSANLAVYSATKNAIRGLTEALSIELRSEGVRAADVLPGLIDTGMVPPEQKAMLPKDGPWRLIDPREVAETVWRAYSEDLIHWYVPPELKELDVQATLAPEAARDQFLAASQR